MGRLSCIVQIVAIKSQGHFKREAGDQRRRWCDDGSRDDALLIFEDGGMKELQPTSWKRQVNELFPWRVQRNWVCWLLAFSPLKLIWRVALERVYYHMWNRLPVQVWCMRQGAWAGALGWPWGMGWGGRWEWISGWGTLVCPWLIHVDVWRKSLQYCN